MVRPCHYLLICLISGRPGTSTFRFQTFIFHHLPPVLREGLLISIELRQCTFTGIAGQQFNSHSKTIVLPEYEIVISVLTRLYSRCQIQWKSVFWRPAWYIALWQSVYDFCTADCVKAHVNKIFLDLKPNVIEELSKQKINFTSEFVSTPVPVYFLSKIRGTDRCSPRNKTANRHIVDSHLLNTTK